MPSHRATFIALSAAVMLVFYAWNFVAQERAMAQLQPGTALGAAHSLAAQCSALPLTVPRCWPPHPCRNRPAHQLGPTAL